VDPGARLGVIGTSDAGTLGDAGTGRLTLQGNEFARKGKWKESGRFSQSAEFAKNGKSKERKT